MPDMPTGVLYYAIGERFAGEAERSAASVRRHMPAIPIAICTDSPVDPKLFETVTMPPDGLSLKQLKMHVLKASPFERTLFLDTDTLMLEPVWEIFDVLDAYDVAMALAPGYRLRARDEGQAASGVPAAYPAWNSGVIAARRSPEAQDLFASWSRLFVEMNRPLDQPALRVAAYRSAARIAPLPYSYNYRLTYPGGVRGVVKILHGRDPDLSTMERRINRRLRMRGTLPRKYAPGVIVHGRSKVAIALVKAWSQLRGLARHRRKT